MASPEVWGPSAWRILHSASWSERGFVALVDILQRVLPCPHCRESFKFYCTEIPIACLDMIQDPEAYAKWAWKLHDSVNLKLKKTPRLPFSTLQRRREAFGTAVSSEEIFGLLFVVAEQSSRTDAAEFAPRLAAAFPTAFFAPFLRAPVPKHQTMFEHLAAQKRAMCIAAQQPIETLGQLRERCAVTRATYVPKRSNLPAFSSHQQGRLQHQSSTTRKAVRINQAVTGSTPYRHDVL